MVMTLVIDANILFAALIRDSVTREILLFSSHDFYAPEYTLREFKEKIPELIRKTKLEKKELLELIDHLVQIANITFVPFEDFKKQKQKAIEITPDPDDVAYLALAMYLNCPLWSNDKALQKQSVVKIITTKELVKK
jgi:predicted nucleic acid-binding protein